MSDTPTHQSKEWNYHPDLPLQDPSVFRWPPEPGFLIRWVGRNWLTLSERVMMVLLAVFMWCFIYPPVEAAQSLAIGWIAQVWLVNFALVFAVAGGLHWYFYMRKGQGITV